MTLIFQNTLKIYSTKDDKKIEYLGIVLKNKKSRAMWQLMINSQKPYYLKEMAKIIEKDANPRLPIYEHHINNMIKAGIVVVDVKMHNHHYTRFYSAAPIVMLAPPNVFSKVVSNKNLKNTFSQVVSPILDNSSTHQK